MPDDQPNGDNPYDINSFKRTEDVADQQNTEPTFSSEPDTQATDQPPAGTPAAASTESAPFGAPSPQHTPSDSEGPAEYSDSTETTVVPEPGADRSVTPSDSSYAFDTEPATQPSAMPAMTETTFAQPVPEKKSKKRLIIGGIVAALLVLGVGGSAAAYTLVYQAPEKVLADAMTNLIQAKAVVYDGSLVYQSKDGDNKLNITFDGQANRASYGQDVDVKLTIDKKTYPLKASFLQTEDVTFYFKLDNLTETIESYQEEGEAIPPAARKLLDAIDGQWVNITLSDIKEWAQEYADTQKCVGEVFRSVKNDDAKFKEIADVYSKNPFVVSKGDVQSNDGNFGFDLDIDNAKQKSFVKGLNETALMKKLQKCDDSYKLNPEDYKEEKEDIDEKSNVRVYVSQWTHELRQVVSTYEDEENKGEFNLKPRFVDSVNVVAPTKAMTIEELQKLIDEVQQELYGGMEAPTETSSN